MNGTGVRIARAILAAAMAAAVGLGGSPARAADPPDPTLTLSDNLVLPGTRVMVRGDHWTPGATVTIRVCGNLGLDGSVDCDQASSVAQRIWSDGTLQMPLAVNTPPSPCPCVVSVALLDGGDARATPIRIIGALEAAPAAKAPAAKGRTLKVRKVEVTREVDLAQAMGGAAPRVLVLEVENTGDYAVERARVKAAWGKGDDPNHLIHTPKIARIEPGTTETIRVPFDLDTGSVGTYEVRGDVGVVGNRATFSTTTSQWPWGLFVALVILVQIVLLAIRNRVRARTPEEETAALGGVSDEDLAPPPISWRAPS